MDELLIANAYFVPTPALSAALKEAAQRCVAVTLITNSPETNDLMDWLRSRGPVPTRDDAFQVRCRGPQVGFGRFL